MLLNQQQQQQQQQPRGLYSRRLCFIRNDNNKKKDAASSSGELMYLPHDDDDTLYSESTVGEEDFEQYCEVEDCGDTTSQFCSYNILDRSNNMDKNRITTTTETNPKLPSMSVLRSLAPRIKQLRRATVAVEPTTPTPEPILKPPPTLKSVLKTSKYSTSSTTKNTKKSARLNLGVRGLWNETTENPFSRVDHELLQSIVSFATPTDLSRLSMVSKRFQYVSHQAWKVVDATDMLETIFQYHHHSAAAAAATTTQTTTDREVALETSKTLASCLNKHRPERLTIRSIGNRLQADKFLPSVKGLQELTLSAFEDLTDTHVHVMLLGVADGQLRSKKQNNLRKLHLEHCPRLGNATVRSIASHCPNLEDLSLHGCSQVSDLTALRKCWKHHRAAAPVVPTLSSLGSLFAPAFTAAAAPPSRPKPMESLFSPPPPSTPKPRTASPPPPNSNNTSSSSLQSLFAPLGSSPPGHRVTVTASTTMFHEAKLVHLDVSYTRVTPATLLHALRYNGNNNNKIELHTLRMLGTSWHKDQLYQLQQDELLHMPALQTLEIGNAPLDTDEESQEMRGLNAFLRGSGSAAKLRSRLEASLTFC